MFQSLLETPKLTSECFSHGNSIKSRRDLSLVTFGKR